MWRHLLSALTREEWRLHAALFPGRRFGAFPLTIAALAAITAGALVAVGVPIEVLVTGGVLGAFLLGVQTGTIGFFTTDSIENTLGETTLLLFSTRTLPLSARKTVAAFLVKDVAYYVVLFIVPVTAGILGGAYGSAAASPSVTLTQATVLGYLPHLFVGSVLAFGAALALSLSASSLLVQTRAVRYGGLGLVGTVVVLILATEPSVEGLQSAVMAPYSLTAYVTVSFGVLALSAVGVVLFTPTRGGGTQRTVGNWYDRLRMGRSDAQTALLVKTLVDLQRRSGGVGRVLAASALLIGALAVVINVVSQWVPVVLLPPVLYGVAVGATAFSTYAGLTEVDDPASYRFYPVALASVFTAKAQAFALTQLLVTLVYVVALVGFGLVGSLLALGVGVAVVWGTSAYVFGATVYMTGFEPNARMFDAGVFVPYTVIISIGLVPVLICGFLTTSVVPSLAAMLAGYMLVLASVGVVFYRRGVRRWAPTV